MNQKILENYMHTALIFNDCSSLYTHYMLFQDGESHGPRRSQHQGEESAVFGGKNHKIKNL